ncbi:hypothetical protein D187_009587 [Cystobacter fuscus DSM 2262]|uniref:Uncharacterized protein n=1 Tax=Cystobacter fuscus (strain ATCC 25194 / DSM 2262 / NBRC 100088 / M29) TaxID=1242864 RepID=S9NVZ0_CYSF2|nr:hypothetical protein D187_009587 [Cystobacter fuscus DSM 2262]
MRPLDVPRTPAPSAAVEEGASRPRRRPMVEVPGPRRADAQPVPTFTVELSQSDIDTEGLEPQDKPPAQAPAAAPLAPPPPPPAILDTPWYAEDIERLPEANASLGQLALENFESLPPLRLRPDVPSASRGPPSTSQPPSSRGK